MSSTQSRLRKPFQISCRLSSGEVAHIPLVALANVDATTYDSVRNKIDMGYIFSRVITITSQFGTIPCSFQALIGHCGEKFNARPEEILVVGLVFIHFGIEYRFSAMTGRIRLTNHYESERTTWVGRSVFINTFTKPSLARIEATLSVKFPSSSTSSCAA